MTLERILEFSKTLLQKAAQLGDNVIDATCGNGNDTLFLANLVGGRGHVYAFDIQPEAIQATKNKLIASNIDNNVTVINDGHENVTRYIQCKISAAIFNLGYLPGSDQTITTHANTTWKAITNILPLLKIGGIIILVIYHGHEAGKHERTELEHLITTLDSTTTQTLRYEFLNKQSAPYIIAIEKTKNMAHLS